MSKIIITITDAPTKDDPGRVNITFDFNPAVKPDDTATPAIRLTNDFLELAADLSASFKIKNAGEPL